MKVRDGFVSNSTSSSFVIRTGVYKSVFDLAQHMVKCRDWESDNDLILAIERGKKRLDRNSSIAFHTCNYDTFIRQFGDRIYIQTCHNHDFNLKGIVDTASDDSFNVSDKGTFWYPEFNLFGRKYIPRDKTGQWDWTKNSYCQQHFTDLIQLQDGDVICPICASNSGDREINCTCKDWLANVEYLLEIQGYRGKMFERCPWCGNALPELLRVSDLLP